MRKLFIFGLFIILQSPIFSQIYDTVSFSNNRISALAINNGNIRDITYDENPIMYSMGFILSGKLGDSLWCNGIFDSEAYLDYAPGKYYGDSTDVRNRFYTLNSNDSAFSSSWEDWKDAVELGANFYDGNNDGLYNPVDLNGNGVWDTNEDRPDLIGDYTNWTIFSDKVPTDERSYSSFNPSDPLGIDVKQTLFAFTRSENEILNNTIFCRYVIENVSENEVFDSVYFGFISDPDIGDYSIDFIGSDSTLNGVFGYKKSEDFQWRFGTNPPAILNLLLQGPLVKGNQFDESNINRGVILGTESIVGTKTLKMTSSWAFWRYMLIYDDMQQGRRNVLLGGKYPNGDDMDVDFKGGGNSEELGSAADTVNLKYIFSGDAVAHNGWLCIKGNDWRMLGSTGLFKLEKNKPQEILLALVIARGNSPLNSVSLVKEYARGVRRFYESNFTDFPVDVKQKVETKIINKFVLEQNYPNPFNPSTTIKYSIPSKAVISNGVGNLKDFSSQNNKNGFAPRNDNVNIKLIVYGILGREVATLVNQPQKPGNYTFQFNASNLSSGVYYYQLKYGEYIQTKKMLLLK